MRIGQIGEIGARSDKIGEIEQIWIDRREQTVAGWTVRGCVLGSDRSARGHCAPWQRHFATLADAILQRCCQLPSVFEGAPL